MPLFKIGCNSRGYCPAACLQPAVCNRVAHAEIRGPVIMRWWDDVAVVVAAARWRRWPGWPSKLAGGCRMCPSPLAKVFVLSGTSLRCARSYIAHIQPMRAAAPHCCCSAMYLRSHSADCRSSERSALSQGQLRQGVTSSICMSVHDTTHCRAAGCSGN